MTSAFGEQRVFLFLNPDYPRSSSRVAATIRLTGSSPMAFVYNSDWSGVSNASASVLPSVFAIGAGGHTWLAVEKQAGWNQGFSNTRNSW